MSAKHTPGPWIVKENRAYKTSWLIYDPEGNQLAQVANWQNETFNCDAEINANLIAAAPDLLDALERLRDAEKAPRSEWKLAIANADIAIAKAKGDAQ